jgi:hypothetical protein
MKRKLCNVTVTLEEPVVRWARIEAARMEISISHLLARILKERMLHRDFYERAMRRALARKPFLMTEQRSSSREEAHIRAGLH